MIIAMIPPVARGYADLLDAIADGEADGERIGTEFIDVLDSEVDAQLRGA